MKKKTLNGYVKDRLVWYLETHYKKSLRKKYITEIAKKDRRLEEVASTYFALLKDEFALELSRKDFGYKSFDDILNKDNKYVLEYNSYLKGSNGAKNLYRDKIKEYAEANNLTMYRLSKLAKTNQSNVSRFFNANDNNALSEKKLKFLIRVTRRYDMLKKKYNS